MRKGPGFSIAGRRLGEDEPCFIIAEAGVNHNGDVGLAEELVRKAKACGADCVKFQTFDAGEIATASAPKAAYQLESTDPSESHRAMLEKLMLPRSAYARLMKLCAKEGIIFLSTPYSTRDIEFLDDLGVAAFKIASGQIIEPRLLALAASKGKPVIASTGMADMKEVSSAVSLLREGRAPFALLQCTSNYPADVADANIRAMATLRKTFKALVGYSDHTLTSSSALAAVALGAKIIEKHFTLDKTLPGPDQSCSAEPADLAALARSIREVEKALGDGRKRPTPAETVTAAAARRSLVAARDIRAGEVLRERDVAVKRPGTGIKPAKFDRVVGRKAKTAIARDSLLSWDQLDGRRR